MIFWLFCFLFCFGGGQGNGSCDLFVQYNCCREFFGGKNCWVVDALGIPCCMNLMSYVSVVPLERMLQNLYEFCNISNSEMTFNRSQC